MSDKDILYNPKLGYEKKYYTEGQIENKNNTTDRNNDIQISKENNINNKINRLIDEFQFLPDSIINTYLAPFIVMRDEYNRIKGLESKNKNVTPPEKEKKPGGVPPIEIEDDNDNKPNPNIPSLFDRKGDVYIETSDPWAEPVKIIKNSYIINFIDIYEDYLNKLDKAVSNYINNILQALSISNAKGQMVSYSTKDIKNSNLYHLSDYITKSNIGLNQNLRLHKKIFQLDETILHIKKIRVSMAQLVRYNEEDEIQQNDFLDVDSNVLLKESRRVAERKYENNLFNLYKYLNSSVILIDGSLKTITKQNKSMMTIEKYEK